ncbi:hypothetical protein WJX74_003024 [Apatococcus lobatus]|uniref:Anaphase-promoting complex subunit 2 n=1 Tax=Apatococcus lobatus TaxID=904363 RepID=A0AAW1RXG7_9CHLO
MVELRSWATFLDTPNKAVSTTDSSALRDPVTAVLASAVLGRKYERELVDELLPKFGRALAGCDGNAAVTGLLQPALQVLSNAVHAQLQNLADFTYQAATSLAQANKALPASLLNAPAKHLRSTAALLQRSAEYNLTGLLHDLYTEQMERFRNCFDDDPGTIEDLTQMEGSETLEKAAMDISPSRSAASIKSQAWVAELARASANLRKLGLKAMSEQVAASVVNGNIEQHLQAAAHGVFSRPVLHQALAYAKQVPLQFLQVVLPPQASDDQSLQQWQSKLEYCVYEMLGSMRIREMFDIVVDYPDTRPALEDLKTCLIHTNLHSYFISSFRSETEARLLHPGAATKDIIEQYVATIRSLREVDPPGVLLAAVGRPIKTYLQGRRDTIRCIVTALTDDTKDSETTLGNESLFDELGRGAIEEAGENQEDADTDEALLSVAERWEPDPVDADSSMETSPQDVISMLVGIYGSKELFINEYRVMLADKLLAKMDYDCDREIRTLELLKIRFGDSNMHNCEIMLKDLADSKRLNASIKQLPAGPDTYRSRSAAPDSSVDNMTATILSELFWPALPQESICMPKEVDDMLKAYAAKFHTIKAPRKLQWRPHLGSVDLKVTVGVRTLELSVSPVCAAILHQFKARAEWSSEELSASLQMPSTTLRRKIIFWINQGLLLERKDAAQATVYIRAEHLDEHTKHRLKDDQDAALSNGPDSVSPQQQLHQEMAMYESYIMGMLTNFDDGLPLERIHNMLKMFVVEPAYDKTAEQLAAFLGKLASEEKLQLVGSVFKRKA